MTQSVRSARSALHVDLTARRAGRAHRARPRRRYRPSGAGDAPTMVGRRPGRRGASCPAASTGAWRIWMRRPQRQPKNGFTRSMMTRREMLDLEREQPFHAQHQRGGLGLVPVPGGAAKSCARLGVGGDLASPTISRPVRRPGRIEAKPCLANASAISRRQPTSWSQRGSWSRCERWRFKFRTRGYMVTCVTRFALAAKPPPIGGDEPEPADLLAWYDRHRRVLPWRAAAGASRRTPTACGSPKSCCSRRP